MNATVGNDPLAPETLASDALRQFNEHAQTTARDLLTFADTTQNNEITILTALRASAEAYRFYGFAQAVKRMVEVVEDVVPASIVEMEEKTGKEARLAALNLIKVLRSFGFTTTEIDDFSGPLRLYNENARLLGQANALLEWGNN